MDKLDISVLRERLSIDFDTGIITRKKRPIEDFKSNRLCNSWNARFSGKVATRSNGLGYLRVNFNGCDYMAHKLVWAFKHGYFPDHEIDHKNHNRSDNRIENLMKSSYKDNNKNKLRYKNNTSGTTGVVWHKRQKRWIATIFTEGKRTHIGSYESKDEAIQARKNKQDEMGFDPSHGDYNGQ